jgi:hypothetical protein
VRAVILSGTWATREIFIAFVTANLPVLFWLFRNWLAPVVSLLNTKLSSHPPTDHKGSESSETGQLSPATVPVREIQPGRSASSLSTLGYNTSEEFIGPGTDEVALYPLPTRPDHVSMPDTQGLCSQRAAFTVFARRVNNEQGDSTSSGISKKVEVTVTEHTEATEGVGNFIGVSCGRKSASGSGEKRSVYFASVESGDEHGKF